MEYQKIINLFGNSPNQPIKNRTKTLVEINDDSSGTYTTGSQIKFKDSMWKSSLYDYRDAYILVSGTMSVATPQPKGVLKIITMKK